MGEKQTEKLRSEIMKAVSRMEEETLKELLCLIETLDTEKEKHCTEEREVHQ